MWLICINRVRTLVRVTSRLNDCLWVWRSTLFTVATVTLLRQPAVQQHISFWCVVTTRHRHTTQPPWLSELVRASHISCTALGGGVPLVTSHWHRHFHDVTQGHSASHLCNMELEHLFQVSVYPKKREVKTKAFPADCCKHWSLTRRAAQCLSTSALLLLFF